MSIINVSSLIAGFLVIVIYGLYFLYLSDYQARDKRFQWSKRLTKITLFKEDVPEGQEDLSLLKASPDTYFKSKLPKIEGLKEWLQHAGFEIKPMLFLTISTLIGLGAAILVFTFFHASILISVLLGVISGFVFPWIFISCLTMRYKSKFLNDFPIALDIIRRALRAGHSIDRALGMVAEQHTGVVGETFKRIIDALRLGQSFENVLAETSNRLGIDDFRMLAIVIILQRETGGSLAEAIENFAKIIRARQMLRKKILSLTAEVRVTAMILIAIPFFIFVTLYFITPHYFDPLYYTEQGNNLLLFGITMLVIGATIIIRMSYKETY